MKFFVRYLCIEGVSREIAPFLEIVSGVVLAAGGEHQGQRAVIVASDGRLLLALESLDVLDSVVSGDQGILAGGLLTAAPPGVAEDVDIGSPEGQASLAGGVHRAGLDCDGAGESAPQRPVEGSSGEDDLGEPGCSTNRTVEGDSGAVGGDAVEGLGPPLVRRESEAGDSGRGVGELLNLLRESEGSDEGGGAGGHRERGVAEGEGGIARGLAGHLGELIGADRRSKA